MNHLKVRPKKCRRNLSKDFDRVFYQENSKFAKEPSDKRSPEKFHSFPRDGPPEVNPKEKRRVRRNLFGEDYDAEYKRMIAEKRRKHSQSFTSPWSSASSTSVSSMSSFSSSSSSSSRAIPTFDDESFLKPSEPKMKESWRKRGREEKKSMALNQHGDDEDFSPTLGYCCEYDGVFDEPTFPW